MHCRSGRIAYRLWPFAHPRVGTGGVPIKARATVGRAFSAFRGAHLAPYSVERGLSGMLGTKRISGGAGLGQSGYGSHNSGNHVDVAESFGDFVVGRPLSG